MSAPRDRRTSYDVTAHDVPAHDVAPDRLDPAELVELVERARRWLAADPDPANRRTLATVIERNDHDELDDLFGAELSFGTAGLRGEMGPGPNRMNRVVVRRAAAALADHLLASPRPTRRRRPLVIIGYDARHHSAVFAADVASVMASRGVDVEQFDEPVPTPLLAVTVTERAASGGLMVTASHNPAGDNGLKLYAADGAQIVPPADEDIAQRISRRPLVSTEDGPDGSGPAAAGSITPLGGPTSSSDAVDRYLRRAAELVGPALASSLRVVHTSLHGVGDALLTMALQGVDGVDATPVASQARPDPDFPTVASPNPEEPGALDELLRLAASVDADVALALDPDADRLAVAMPAPGADDARWTPLTGDQIGALLAEHLLRTTHGRDRLVVSTLVSSGLVLSMCAEAGVHHAETLTGFKWLCRPGLAHPEWHQLLLYEEALGYAVGPTTRDKDGITAALVVLAAIAGWRAQGRTVWDVLDALALRHGAHVTRNGSVPTSAATGFEGRLDALVAAPPAALGGLMLRAADRPAPDIVRWRLSGRTRVVIRPSGTEPKVKYYVESVEPVGDSVRRAERAAATRAESVAAELAQMLSG